MSILLCTPERVTLEASFDPRRNSLNAIRLALAATVIVSHSVPLGGYGPDPEIGGVSLGTLAVIGFFVVSGFLITRSCMARSWKRYFTDRFLRIVPGFIAALLLTAFVIAPASALLRPRLAYELWDSLEYVGRNLLLHPPVIGQASIGETASDLPYPDRWNGPAWTLFYEATCYVGIAAAVRWIRPHLIGPLLTMATAILMAACFLMSNDVYLFVSLPGVVLAATQLALAFCVGAALFVYRSHVLLTWPHVVGAIIVLGVVFATGQASAFAAIPIAMVLFKLSSVLPLQQVGARYDISYGMYIYGWPLQLLLMIALQTVGVQLPVVLYVVLSLAFASLAGIMSSILVERPALKLKGSRKPA